MNVVRVEAMEPAFVGASAEPSAKLTNALVLYVTCAPAGGKQTPRVGQRTACACWAVGSSSAR